MQAWKHARSQGSLMPKDAVADCTAPDRELDSGDMFGADTARPACKALKSSDIITYQQHTVHLPHTSCM